MEYNIRGKTLLFIDGSALCACAVNEAKKNGIRTVVANWFPAEKNPGKRVADVSVDIDFTDSDAMLKLIHDEDVDGIYAGYTDSYLPTYQALCEKAKLPCYLTAEQVESSINKKKFKEMCRRNGVATVPQFALDDTLSADDLAKITYPAIVKPTDNSGSRGVSICWDENELRDAVKKATDLSKSRSFIVERYFDPEVYGDFCVYYTIWDGEPTLSAMCDRVMHIDKSGLSPLPIMLKWPSKYLDGYQKKADLIVKEMFRREGFKNGTLFMQGFAADGGFYFFEIGYRNNGSQQYILTEHANGNNAQQMMMKFALTGEMDSTYRQYDDPHFPFYACNLVILLKPGKINQCYGLDVIKSMKSVLNVTQLLMPGDTVGEQGTLAQTFARVHIVEDTEEALACGIQKIMDTLQVMDAEGNDLIMEVYK